jgi:hypothetical protein
MGAGDAAVIESLLAGDEPAIEWKLRREVLRQPAGDLEEVRERVRRSPRAVALLAGTASGNVYNKWHGAHWVLAALADLGYPGGAAELEPLRDRVADAWLEVRFYSEFETGSSTSSYGQKGVPLIDGRYRSHGSQHGNALRAMCRLELVDGRAEQLVERLLHWQWPDGGWNCDRHPAADTSSFMETLLPMRGLQAFAEATGDGAAAKAARRAAEVFLSRRMFRRRSDGGVINPDFTRLHFPLYWHYDVLGGLRGLTELGLLGDPRCPEALDLLEEMRLPSGGWSGSGRFYSVSAAPKPNTDSVDWGSGGARMNPWVTAEALGVLAAAGRLQPAV